MSVMGASAAGAASAATEIREPRVREQAREAVTLMAFSAAVSLSVLLAVLFVSWLGR